MGVWDPLICSDLSAFDLCEYSHHVIVASLLVNSFCFSARSPLDVAALASDL